MHCSLVAVAWLLVAQLHSILHDGAPVQLFFYLLLDMALSVEWREIAVCCCHYSKDMVAEGRERLDTSCTSLLGPLSTPGLGMLAADADESA